VKSSTRRLGEHVQKGVLAFYVACFVLVIAAAWVGGLGPLFLPLAALVAVHLSRQAAGCGSTIRSAPWPCSSPTPRSASCCSWRWRRDVEAAGVVGPPPIPDKRRVLPMPLGNAQSRIQLALSRRS
jgi:hypothetical protein